MNHFLNKKNIFVLLVLFIIPTFLFFSLKVEAASSGPNNPATAADDSLVGSITWSNTGNVFTSNDVYATAGLDDNQISHYVLDPFLYTRILLAKSYLLAVKSAN